MDAVVNERTTSPVESDVATFTKWMVGRAGHGRSRRGRAVGEG